MQKGVITCLEGWEFRGLVVEASLGQIARVMMNISTFIFPLKWKPGNGSWQLHLIRALSLPRGLHDGQRLQPNFPPFCSTNFDLKTQRLEFPTQSEIFIYWVDLCLLKSKRNPIKNFTFFIIIKVGNSSTTPFPILFPISPSIKALELKSERN